MRLRNIPGSKEIIGESRAVIQEPESWRGRWAQAFGNERPVHIEVGMGKGQFLMEMARRNPEINYVGIEMYDSVLLRAVQKLESQEERPDNLYFIRMDARELPQVFAPGEVGRIYLNFSDPWPKERHAKRRLTSRQFLERYDQILAPEGEVHFKTDNRPLFEFSLQEAEEAGWMLKGHTFDLHRNLVLCEGNVMTEYEEKFSALGNPIHKMIACRERAQKPGGAYNRYKKAQDGTAW